VLILLGTCITSAASYGFTYLASLSQVASLAGDNVSRATAGLFVYAYFGFSIPVIASGLLADALGLRMAILVFLAVQVVATLVIMFFWKRGIRHVELQ